MTDYKRITIRLEPETYELIKNASKTSGRSINKFMIYAAKKEAKELKDIK